MTEGIKKIRKGLDLFIRGMLQETLEIMEENSPLDKSKSIDRIILETTKYRMEKIGEYLRDNKIYFISEKNKEKFEELEIAYKFTKNKLNSRYKIKI